MIYVMFVILLLSGSSVCFDDLNDYFKYRLDNPDSADVEYPCPPFNSLLTPKDESNK